MIAKLLNMIFKQSFMEINHKDKWVYYHMKQTTKEDINGKYNFQKRK